MTQQRRRRRGAATRSDNLVNPGLVDPADDAESAELIAVLVAMTPEEIMELADMTQACAREMGY